jgi:hypothetical protein
LELTDSPNASRASGWFFCTLLQEDPVLDLIPFREGGSGAVLPLEFPMSHKFFTDILEKLSCLGLVFAR